MVSGLCQYDRNTEEIAELIVEGITASGHEADLKSVTDFNAAEVLNYEGFMIGVYMGRRRITG